MMTTAITSPQNNNTHQGPIILDLPTGNLGVHFSKTVPCEIARLDEESPIFESSLQCLGRLAFHLSIPDKLDIYGALDNETLENILSAYSDVPNRKLMFKNRGGDFNEELVTTTILPTGPINATFRCSRGIFAYRSRVLVKNAPTEMNFEFPAGNYVEKVIIPNQVILEGGLRTMARLIQTLDHFAEVPGRRIVFQKKIPRGGVITKICLPQGPVGIVFDAKLGLPIVSMVCQGSWADRLNIPLGHYVEKLIVPNKIAIERMGCDVFEQIFNHFSNVDNRTIVLNEVRNDIRNTGATLTISLPTGSLGVVFRSTGGYITVARVKDSSPLKETILVGYVVERFVIPGEFELVGLDEMDASTFTETIKQYCDVPYRILILKQRRKDVQINSASYTNELF